MADTLDVTFGEKSYTGKPLTGPEMEEFELDFAQLMASTSDKDNKVEGDIRALNASRKAEALGMAQVLIQAKGGSYIGHRKTGTGWKLICFRAEDFGMVGQLKHEFSVTCSLGVNGWIGLPGTLTSSFILDDYAAMMLLGELIPYGAARVHNAVLAKRDTNGKAYNSWNIPRNAPRLFTYPAPLILLNQESVQISHNVFVSGSSSSVDLSIPIGMAVVRAEKELAKITAGTYLSVLLGM